MKTPRELIKSIQIDKSNLNHIADTGKINGSLLFEIERILKEHANQSKQDWINVSDRLPNQKDLVLVEFDGISIPAIFYRSMDNVFYHYSLYYHSNKKSTYSKARISKKHRIEGVVKWKLIEI